VNARTLIGLTAAPEHRGDCDGENIIFNNARARRSTDPCVEFTTRNFKYAAKRSDWKPILLDIDELKFQWLPLAKNTAAFFKISKSISTRLFSRRSRASSSRSSLVNAPIRPLPASISARRTQSRRAVSVGFKSLTSCTMLRSPTW
jgi:hypothetical protein